VILPESVQSTINHFDEHNEIKLTQRHAVVVEEVAERTILTEETVAEEKVEETPAPVEKVEETPAPEEKVEEKQAPVVETKITETETPQ